MKRCDLRRELIARLIAQPHGGSFGGKGGARGCDITAMLSRKSNGRPVKWIEDRLEYLGGGAAPWKTEDMVRNLAFDKAGK